MISNRVPLSLGKKATWVMPYVVAECFFAGQLHCQPDFGVLQFLANRCRLLIV